MLRRIMRALSIFAMGAALLLAGTQAASAAGGPSAPAPVVMAEDAGPASDLVCGNASGYVIAQKDTPVRRGWSATEAVLAWMDPNDRANIAGSYCINKYENLWYKVNFAGTVGWVYSGNVKAHGGIEALVPVSPALVSAR
ncbi:hypothetical protein ACOBQB_10190 [Streptomyces sp. G5(2025)]|uniref:hypothetical protein n=1 Tax=Streptomyces sp. G5(2025) TaxID=3406628 RepID=UPI003C14375D